MVSTLLYHLNKHGLSLVSGARHTPVYPSILKIVVLTNAVSFFGPSLGKSTIRPHNGDVH